MTIGEELLAVRMRLSGQRQYIAGMEESTAATRQFGETAVATGAQAKEGAAGIDAMAASSSVGAASMASRMKSAGKSMKAAGRTMTTGLTVPIALIGGIAIKSSLDFHDAMLQVQTQAGASAKEVHRLTGQVMAFAASGQSTAGPTDLAKGLYQIESAGIRGRLAMKALTASEHLAMVGHTDLEQTTHVVASSMTALGLKAKDLGSVIGTLNAIVGQGQMHMSDLNSALGTGVLDRAAALGLGIKDVGAALATLTATGQPATASATRMTMAFTKMAAPTATAAAAMKSIGLGSGQLALNMRQKGLIPTLTLLKKHLDDTFGTSKRGMVKQAQAISAMFGGGRTSGGVVGLIRHIDLLHTKMDGLHGVTEKFRKALDKTEKSPKVQLQLAWAKLQAVFVQLGDILIPTIIPALKMLADVLGTIFDAFNGLPKPVKNFMVGALLLLAIAGPILMFFGSLASAIAVLAGVEVAAVAPWLLIPAAIAAVIIIFVLLYKKVKWFRDGVNAVFNFVKDHWKLLVAIFLGPLVAIGVLIATHWKQIVRFFVHGFQKVKGAVSDGWQWIKNAFSNGINFVLGFLKSHWKLIAAILTGPVGAATIFIISHFKDILHFITGMPGKIASAAHGMFDGITEAFKSALNAVIGMWNNLSFHLGGTDVGPVHVPGVTINTPDLPKLAYGGTVMTTGAALVGERGPELLSLPRGARVEPLASPRVSSSRLDHSGGVGWRRTGDTVVHTTVELDRKVLATAVTRAAQDEAARR